MTDESQGKAPAGQASLPRQPVWRSDQILRGEKEVLILHRGEVYRLRETRNGRLILGK